MILRSLILWALLVGTCCAQQLNWRPVDKATNPPLQSLVTGWMTLAPVKQVNIAPKTLADIESRMPDGHIYRDADLVTWAHETTHGINSRCRVWAGAGMNAFYCLEGNVAILREPRVTKSNVCRYVPAHLRGDVWGLYMAGQTAWDDTPLYILDEWVSYINGAYVAVELDRAGKGTNRSTAADIAHSVEFASYASAILACVDANDSSYTDRDKLAKFIAFNLERTFWLAKQGGSQQQVDAFAVAYVNGGSSACANGNCQSWSWGQGRWQPSQPVATKPVSPRPQPPAKPVPTNPPVAGGAGCKCDPSKSCACDKNAACKCDRTLVAKLEIRIAELERKLADGPAKGDRGEAGPAGPVGPKGDTGKDGAPGKDSEPGKSCNCKEPTGPSAAPEPVYFDIKPRKRK